jgi:class 3 adenylate cyclase
MFRANLTLEGSSSTRRATPFVGQLVVGRPPNPCAQGDLFLPVDDPQISRRHCVIRQSRWGRFYIRDESVNGTRVDGRRLIPNAETEIRDGASIELARRYTLRLEVGEAVSGPTIGSATHGGTVQDAAEETVATVLVGDIAEYSTMARQVPAAELALAVKSLFGELEEMIGKHSGTLKEYQGDAIVAFWEHDENDPRLFVRHACACALELADTVSAISDDPGKWPLKKRHPLEMHWALTTGPVALAVLGQSRPMGLAMTGDVVNFAFRLEKLADAHLGPILVSSDTADGARDFFEFEAVGKHVVEDRPGPEPVYVLRGENQTTTSRAMRSRP